MNELDHAGRDEDEGGPQVAGSGQDPAASSPPRLCDPTAEIERLRARLLGGRGPGAPESERTVFMHNRPTLGALPTMIERELVQVHTDLAREDAAAIQADLERVRLQLAGTLDHLAARLSPAGLAAGARRQMQARFEALLGLPSGQPPGESRSGDGASSAPNGGTAGNATDEVGLPSTWPVGNPWWWQVATRSAALGAATAVATVVLIVLVRRRRSRRIEGSVRRRGAQRGAVAGVSAGRSASWR